MVLNKQIFFSVVIKRNHCCRKKTIRIIYRVYPACEPNALCYIVILGLSGSTTLYHKEYRFRKGTKQRMYVLNIFSFCFKQCHSQNNSQSCYHKCIFNIHRCMQVQPARCHASNLFLQAVLHSSVPHQKLKTTPYTCYRNTASLNLTD